MTTTTLARHGWRPLLLLSGVLLAAGGRMHPDAEAHDPLRQELATMTADPAWVPGHTLIVVSTVLLTAALWLAPRGWPAAVRAPFRIAAVAFALYTVETVFHLAAVTDSHALAHGDAAPVAMTHVGLSVLLYPPTGLALAWLAIRLGRTWRGPRRAIAAIGVVAGLLHASSVPATLLFPNSEVSPLFAGAGLSLALFSVLTALAGAPRPAVVPDAARKLPAAV